MPSLASLLNSPKGPEGTDVTPKPPQSSGSDDKAPTDTPTRKRKEFLRQTNAMSLGVASVTPKLEQLEKDVTAIQATLRQIQSDIATLQISADLSRSLQDRLAGVDGRTQGLMAWVHWYEAMNGVLPNLPDEAAGETSQDEDMGGGGVDSVS
ncbi:hypothetical protein N0V84_012009 [Fusarium piperis]|uniref:Uncharacterized protein n=1 Tax=Fusarium piperis TaxID=1435070 RepID=A0A9W8TAW1_9HYPO|nr:hypothetical protein N0V84_012009 [Fusarium piperis]